MQTPELTEAQEKTLLEVFQYTDKADISDEEIAIAKEMFDSPEKFVLLRKILGVITQYERGIHYEGEHAGLTANSFEAMGLEITVQKNVEARIKGGLSLMYNLVRGTLREEEKQRLLQSNLEKMDKQEFEEEKAEDIEEANRPGGPNL